jgi:hypothetical protein
VNPRNAKRAGAVLGLAGALGASVSGAVVATSHTVAAGASPATIPAPQVTNWVPSYAAALSRPETADEQRIGATTPANDTRLVASAGEDAFYIGRVTEANALCLSIENAPSNDISTTCGGDKAIPAGQLFLARGGEAEDGVLTTGVAPDGVATVRLVTERGSATVTRVRGGIYFTRTTDRVTEFRFLDGSGGEVAALKLPPRKS